MRKTLILRLSLLIVSLTLLWSCANEDFIQSEKNPHRNNQDFFTHSKNNDAFARAGVDYIDILEGYKKEKDFLAQMPDQEGMPIWEKMQVLNVDDKTVLYVPLSSDKTDLSSLILVTLDESSKVTVLRNFTNDYLKMYAFNPEYPAEKRRFLMDTFLQMDFLTFKQQRFTNLPADLYKGLTEYNRMNILGATIETKDNGRFIYQTICRIDHVCPNSHDLASCDYATCTGHGNNHEMCVAWSSCTSTTEWIDDPSTFYPSEPSCGVGCGNGGGGAPNPNTPPKPTDPCAPTGINKAFYRMLPGCFGGNTGSGDDDVFGDPCEKLQTQIENLEFTGKISDLKSKLPLKREIGYIEKIGGTFDYKDNASSTENGNSLTLGNPTPDMIAYMHTHPNDFEDSEGRMRIGFKIFSPADVIYFNQLVAQAQQNGIPLGDIYAVMVSIKGTYQIRFTGNANQIKTVYTNTKEQYNDMYIKYFQKYDDRSDELNFLKFIDEHMYVKGITLVKMNDNGTFTKKKLSADKTQVEDEDCL